MENLELIGIGTIIFLIYKYLIVPIIEKTQNTEIEFDRKVGLLSDWHPEIRKLFRNFENDQQQSKNRNSDDFEKGGYLPLFNKLLFVYYNHQVEGFKNEVIAKVKEIETSPEGKSEVESILKRYEKMVAKANKDEEIKHLQKRKIFLVYNDILKDIFPNSNVILEEKNIVNKLSAKLNLTISEAQDLLINLSKMDTGIIFRSSDNFKNNGIKHYWYDESAKR